MKQSFKKTIALIYSDMQFRCDYEHKELTLWRALGFLLNHAMMSQLLYRLQGFFYTHHLGVVAGFLQSLNSIVFTVSIDSRTNIGPGFLLLHANYIHIGKNVTLGKNCILTQQNALGPDFMMHAHGETSAAGPVIGDNVLLGVGSVVFGNIVIGSNSKVAANSSVDKSFPENSVLVGVPAKNRAMT